jgi:hypothetical protein
MLITICIAYGFGITPEKRDLMPYLGRIQSRGCYFIQIAFPGLLKTA